MNRIVLIDDPKIRSDLVISTYEEYLKVRNKYLDKLAGQQLCETGHNSFYEQDMRKKLKTAAMEE